MKIYEIPLENVISPLEKSHSHSTTDRQLNSLFIQVFNDLFSDRVRKILNYGSPAMANDSDLIEQFSKMSGLVLYNTSLRIKELRVLYEAWTGLSTKRGLGFIEFILKSLWGSDGYYLNRTFHPVATISNYPRDLSYIYDSGMFVTPRVVIGVYDKNNFNELKRLAPTLQQIAPINVVVDVVSATNLGELRLNLRMD